MRRVRGNPIEAFLEDIRQQRRLKLSLKECFFIEETQIVCLI